MKFKIGDKVFLKKGITAREFELFGNQENFIKNLYSRKFSTIVEIVNDRPTIIRVCHNHQWWKESWFEKYIEQLEFNFE